MAMQPTDHGPPLTPWFWEILESSSRSLLTLARQLERLPQERLIAYHVQFDEAKSYINPYLCPEIFAYLDKDQECSEDDADDFAAWIVMQGQAFYKVVRTEPASIQRHLDQFHQEKPADCWDESVDREEYRGYQRADFIASPIYAMRFGRDLEEDSYDDRGLPRRDLDIYPVDLR